MPDDTAPQKPAPAKHGHHPGDRAHFAMWDAHRLRRRLRTGRWPDRNRVTRGKGHLNRLIELSLTLFRLAVFSGSAHESPADPTSPGQRGHPHVAQPGAIPLSASSLIAFSFFDRSDMPMPRSTFGALVNWMLSYPTISIRLPQGSRKSRKRPGSGLIPAAASARRTASLSSTTSPK